jgi:hypothetical protein
MFVTAFVLGVAIVSPANGAPTDAEIIELKMSVDNLKSELAPLRVLLQGAVIAFHRSAEGTRVCPEGWDLFRPAAGRFVLGAGAKLAPDNKDENGVQLSDHPSFKEDSAAKKGYGGEEATALKIEQMPRHTHRISTDYNRPDVHNGLAGGTYAAGSDYGIITPFEDIPNKPGWNTVVDILEKTGGLANGATLPHNNMPPYVALYYCIKQ